MNIEIANRLVEYRRKHHFSQEELAEKIGVSRQAVSKWERAEASPDTDNLIMLAKIYHVTLDELLQGEAAKEDAEKTSDRFEEEEQDGSSAAEEPCSSEEDIGNENTADSGEQQDYVSFKNGIHIEAKNGDRVNIGLQGVHVEDHNGEKVHIDWNGIHVDSPKENAHIHIGADNIYTGENGDRNIPESPLHRFFKRFPYPIIAVAAYLLFGFFDICGGWAFGWLILLTVPLYYSLTDAVFKHNPSHFAYPVLVVLIFLWFGFYRALWHPMWVLFLTIPFYYFLCDFFKNPSDHS